MQPEYLGGNIKSIIPRIEYIKQMGFNTIWLSPFYKGTAYHGYHIENFLEIDPRFGTEEDLHMFINKCKNAKIRTIVDFVPNHCSYKHPYFIDAIKDKHSPYRNWFYINSKNKYSCFLNFKELPKLNLYHTPTESHMLKSAEWLYNAGIDGFRIDHVVGVAPQFLKKLKKLFPEKILIGEAWAEGIHPSLYHTLDLPDKTMLKKSISQSKLQLSYKGILDGILDFQYRKLTIKLHKATPSQKRYYLKKIKKHLEEYSNELQPVLFLDNHDTNRIMYTLKNNKEQFFEALTNMLAQKKPFSIYNGTELGATQEHSVKRNIPHADLEARRPMEWNKTTEDFYNSFVKILKRQ